VSDCIKPYFWQKSR